MGLHQKNFLNCLRVAYITDRTFYLHQKQYLEPSSVESQTATTLSACELPLIIGGDGRADSPGRSAKYGSYGVIDLRTNKFLHIELVQVINVFKHNINQLTNFNYP